MNRLVHAAAIAATLSLAMPACTSRRAPGPDDAPAAPGVPTDAAAPSGTPPVVTCASGDGGSAPCTGINFAPCCGRDGRCGEVNPFVQTCFAFDGPGTLDLGCPTFAPPQGGLPDPGCCRPEGVCGVVVQYEASDPPFSYGCVHPADLGPPASQHVTSCPKTACRTVRFAQHLTREAPARFAAHLVDASDGVAGGERVVFDVRGPLPLDRVQPLVDGADGGTASFASCPLCVRLLSSKLPSGHVGFHGPIGEVLVTQLEVADAGAVDAFRGRLYARLVAWSADGAGAPASPDDGGACIELAGDFTFP